MATTVFKACILKVTLLFIAVMCSFTVVTAQKQSSDSVYYVYRNTGEGIYAVPDSLVKNYEQTNYKINFTLLNDSLISFSKIDVDSVSRIPREAPKFTSFKINNKYNSDLDNDVYCVISGNYIYGDMGNMLGKDLRPSFETDKPAFVYVDSVLQQTRVSRVRFDKEIVYTVNDGVPGVVLDRTYLRTIHKADSLIEIPLTASMLSTNAPTSSEAHSLGKMLDNNPATFFHCTSSSDAPTYEVLPLDSCPYIDITLSKYKRKFAFFYMTRSDIDTRQPLAFKVYANMSNKWVPLDSFEVKDGIPATGVSSTFLSRLIDPGRNIKKIRIECTKSNYKNYLCLAELKLYEPLPGTEQYSVDYYQYFERSLGREYKVNLSFRADTAEVPRLDINVNGGSSINSRDIWLKAKFSLNGKGMYESVEDSIQIKGRGNSSWSWPKKPYTIKFAESTKLCGLKKGKRWNLMSNYRDVTEMMNAVVFKAGRMVNAPYQPHSIPLELYVNGVYKGCYTLTEHVGVHNNCVNEDDYTQLLELDSYYDETYKFKSAHYNLPVNIKNPDFSDKGCPITLSQVEAEWTAFEKALKLNKDIKPYVSMDSFATFMFMNELIGNTELNHPKSTFLYKPTGAKKYIWGPGWDFDYGCNSQTGSYFGSYTYKTIGFMNGIGKKFFADMIANEDVIEAYYKVWVKFVENDGLEELLNWMDDYYAYAEPSYAHSAQNGWAQYQYATYFDTFKTWIKNRVQHIYDNLTVPTGIYDDISADWNENSGSDNNIIVSVEGGVLTVESTVDTTLNIYRVDGSVAGEIEVSSGKSVYPLAPRGVIIVNGCKLYLKPVR